MNNADVTYSVLTMYARGMKPLRRMEIMDV